MNKLYADGEIIEFIPETKEEYKRTLRSAKLWQSKQKQVS